MYDSGDGEGESKDHIEDMGEEHFSPFSKHLTDITQVSYLKKYLVRQ